MGQVFGKRPRVVVDDVVDQDRPVKRPAIAPDAFLRVLGSSEGLTNVLRFTGASSVLALETLSTRAREMIRRGSIEFESSMDERPYKNVVLAYRAELLAIRRAGGFETVRYLFTYDFHGYTEQNSDVRYGVGVVRVPSPRRPPAITAAADDVDLPRSEAHRDALERVRKGLMNMGMIILDASAQRDDREGLAGMRRLKHASKKSAAGDHTVDAAFAAKMVEAMGGAARLPSRLLKAATREYGGWSQNSKMGFVGPRPLEALFARTASSSAHADASTLERVSSAYCWRVFLEPEAVSCYDVHLGRDEATFFEVCREAGVPPRTAAGLWREALGGLLLPFVPTSVPGDRDDFKGGCLVRRGDKAHVVLHHTFIQTCCARAIVARCRGDPLRCFAPDREAQLTRHLPTPGGIPGSLALEVLQHLGELSGGAARVEAAVAAVTSEERLPRIAEGDDVRVAMNWREARYEREVRWSKATYLRRHNDTFDSVLGHSLLVRFEDGPEAGDESDAFSFGVQRVGAMPIAASLLCAAAADGRNELLARLLEAPAFGEVARGSSFANPDQTTALDHAIENANVVGAAILVAKCGFVTTVCPARRRSDHTSPKLSCEQKGDMLAALGLAADRITDDLRWEDRDPSPPPYMGGMPGDSAFESAAAAGDVATVRRMLRTGSFRERVASTIWREPFVSCNLGKHGQQRGFELAARHGHVSVIREMLRSCECVSSGPCRSSAIKLAALEGHADCLELLMSGFQEPNLSPEQAALAEDFDFFGFASRSEMISCVIRRSVRCGHVHVLRRLRELGYSLLTGSRVGDDAPISPLECAAIYGQDAAARALCDDPDVAAELRGCRGRTQRAIVSASMHGQHEVLRIMLETAQIDSFDALFTQYNPLLMACSHGDRHEETINVLLNFGFPIDYSHDGASTALGWAVTNANYEITTLLLMRGASLRSKYLNAQGRNALMNCLSSMCPIYVLFPEARMTVVELLIKERRDELVGDFGAALSFAMVVRSSSAMIELLLKSGADPSAVDESDSKLAGFTAPHWAVMYLVEAELGATDEDAKELAVEHLRLLVNYGASFEIPTTGEYTSDQHALTVPSGATPRDIPLYCENEQARINVFAAIDAAVAARDSSRP